MQELDDNSILKQYAEQDSEEAFAAIVSRHINKVYSVALRHTGNPAEAEEITQAVFVVLARKATSLSKRVVLSGWLYQTARLTSLMFLRGEIRRARREQEAYMESVLNEPVNEGWTEIAPLLDAAMASLNETDRHAVVLRILDGKSLREVGAVLGTTEDAAKMRVNRALEKLRKFFGKGGVHSTTAIIAGAISSNSVQIAPPALAQAVTAAALAKGTAASTSTLTLVKGALKVMAWTKVKTAILVGAGILLAGGISTVGIKMTKERPVDDSWRVPLFDTKALDRASPQVRILPSKFRQDGGYGTGSDYGTHGAYGWMGIGTSAEAVIETAYHESPWRTIFATAPPSGRYDFIAKPPGNPWPQDIYAALQNEVKTKFGVVGHWEMRNTSVLLLTVKRAGAPGLRASGRTKDTESLGNVGEIVIVNEPMHSVAASLENYFQRTIIDQTGLPGAFDFDLKWRETWQHRNLSGLKKVLIDQLGLELVPTNMPIKMLIVEKANKNPVTPLSGRTYKGE